MEKDYRYSKGQEICGFKVLEICEIPERKTIGYRMQHIASGARLLYLDNDDNEKSFSIGFKTPPKDDTGVFHILEHSVLCGSRKFPVKEPFGYLCKTSMATFINACTYPDMTIYPVSSTNEKDLINMMDVYMDAVLFPNLYTNPNIFYQEGGHTTIDDEGYLGFNGVVYNEMKGSLSNPDEVLIEELDNLVFPDTCYGHNSGGEPSSIKKLTYENFCETHKNHYSLNNAYIFLYGNLDSEKFLKYLDNEYLSCGHEILKWWKTDPCTSDKLKPNVIQTQKPLCAPHKIKQMNTDSNNEICGCAFAIDCEGNDSLDVSALNILLDALLSSNESPLKKKFLDAQVCDEVDFFLNGFLYQPILYVCCKKPKNDFKANVLQFTKQAVTEVLKEGIDHKLIQAEINSTRFRLDENVTSMSPGIDASVISLNTWIYDDDKAFENLGYKNRLDKLEELLNENYYEDLLKQNIVDNNHYASCEIKAVDENSIKDDDKQLAVDKYSDAKISEIKKICKSIEKMHNTPDSQDALNTLPSLKLSDVDKKNVEPKFEVIKNTDGEISYILPKIKSDNIAYVDLFFSLDNCEFEDLPYISVLALVLGSLDTKNYTAAEIDTFKKLNLGFLAFACCVSNDFFDINKTNAWFAIKSAALTNKISDLAHMIEEITSSTLFSDKTKLYNILKQDLIFLKNKITNAAHIFAVNRSLSYINKKALATQFICGIDYYYFLNDIVENFDENFEILTSKLNILSSKIFDATPILFTNLDSEKAKTFIENKAAICPDKNSPKENNSFAVPEPKIKNEAFVIPSSVSFCGYNVALPDAEYEEKTKIKAAMEVASTTISYDYLWSEIRLKGGAYGAGCRRRCDEVACYSFRDPNPENSFSTFYKIVEWLKSADLSQKDIENYIINCVAAIDKPKAKRETMNICESRFLNNTPEDFVQKIRSTLLKCETQDMAKLAKILESSFSKGVKCLFGTKEHCLKSGLKVVDIFNS